MSKHFEYAAQGVCSSRIILDIDGDTIENMQVINGCNGNLKGISALVKGRKADEVINALEGITCGAKPTSCPDQIARALKSYLAQQ
ncbi:MAG: TIGR03905 family TSCPD domain-containing protein [Solobacterium sp.]|nr:TIGR03905 family TSCPD domain-containing protein [Solobacterium sp.]